MQAKNVLTISANGKVHLYGSLRKASRALSGTGSDSRRQTIARRCSLGGGKVGDVYVQYTNLESLRRS